MFQVWLPNFSDFFFENSDVVSIPEQKQSRTLVTEIVHFILTPLENEESEETSKLKLFSSTSIEKEDVSSAHEKLVVLQKMFVKLL